MDSKKKQADGRNNAERIIEPALMSPTLHSTASTHSKVEIHDTGNGILGTIQADENGNGIYTSEHPLNEDEQRFSAFVDGQITPDYSIRLDLSSSDSPPAITPTVDTGDTPLSLPIADAVSGDNGPQLQVALNIPTTTENILAQVDITNLSITAVPSIDSALDNAGLETGRVENGATIDDTRPVLSGKSEAIGTFIEIHHNGQFLTQAYVGPLGDWQVRIPAESTLQPGSHEFTVIDNAGQRSEPFTLVVSVPESSRPLIDSVFDDVGKTGEIANGGTTDDTLPTFHGRGEPGTQVFLYEGTVIIGTDFVRDDGTYTIQPTSQTRLTPGEHTFTVSINRIASQPFTLTVADTEPVTKPTIASALDNFGNPGEVANGGLTDDATPTLSGTAEPYTQVAIYDGSTRVGYASTSGNGIWSFTVPTLSQGEHSLTAVTKTIAGTQLTSEPFTLTIGAPESTKPQIDSAFDDFGKPGEVVNGGLTDDATPTLRGKAEPFAQVAIYDGDSRIGYAYSGPNGSWSFQVPTLSQGNHVFTVVNAGVTSDPFTLTIGTPESTKPQIDSAFDDFGKPGEVVNGGLTDDATPTLRGKAEPFAQVAIYDGDSRIGYAYSGPNGSWSFQVPTLSQGNHVFTVVNAGVTSDPFTLTIGAPESTKPQIDSAFDDFGKPGEVVNGGLTDDATPTLRGKAEPFAQVAIYDGDSRIGYAYSGPNGSWSFQVPTLSQGNHVFTVVNAGVTSDPFTLTIGAPDSTKPQIDSAFDDFGKPGEVVNGGLTDDATPTLRGKAEPFAQVAIYDGDSRIGYAYSGPNGSWSFQVPTLSQGNHVFTVVNAGVTSDPFTLTIGAPNLIKPVIDSVVDNIGGINELASGSITDDARPTFHGQGEPNTFLKVYDYGKFVGNVWVKPDGSWTYTDTSKKLSEGQHSFTFVGDGVASEPFVLNVQGVPETSKPQIDSAFDNAGDWTGSVTNGATIDDIRPVISGQAEPDAVVEVYDQDLFIGAAVAGDDGKWTFQPSEFEELNPGEHTFTVVTDGVHSEPFVLHVEAPAQTFSMSAYETDAALPALSELLQSSSELFSGEVDLSSLNESVELSLAGFDDNLNASSSLFETAEGLVVFSHQISSQPWQQETVPTVG